MNAHIILFLLMPHNSLIIGHLAFCKNWMGLQKYSGFHYVHYACFHHQRSFKLCNFHRIHWVTNKKEYFLMRNDACNIWKAVIIIIPFLLKDTTFVIVCLWFKLVGEGAMLHPAPCVLPVLAWALRCCLLPNKQHSSMPASSAGNSRG